jgi:hypothetical protein
MKEGMSDNNREEYLSLFRLLVISPRGVFLAFPSCPSPTISNPPRGVKAKEEKVEPERAAVSNKAWSSWKAFFNGWRRAGLLM